MELEVIVQKSRSRREKVSTSIAKALGHSAELEDGVVEGWLAVRANFPLDHELRARAEIAPLLPTPSCDDERAAMDFLSSQYDLVVAAAASRSGSEAWALGSSDTTNSSVAMRFKNGRLTEARGYGIDGTDLFFQYNGEAWSFEFRVHGEHGFDYSSAYDDTVSQLTQVALSKTRAFHKPLYDKTDPERWIEVATERLYELGDMVVFERGAVPDTFDDLSRWLHELARASVAQKRFVDARKYYSLSAEAAIEFLTFMHHGSSVPEHEFNRNVARAVWNAILAADAAVLARSRAEIARQRERIPHYFFYDRVTGDDRSASSDAPSESPYPLLRAIDSGSDAILFAAVLENVATWRAAITSERLRRFSDAACDEFGVAWLKVAQRCWRRSLTSLSPYIPQGLVDDGDSSSVVAWERPWAASEIYVPAPCRRSP